jgi:hypothetical protein
MQFTSYTWSQKIEKIRNLSYMSFLVQDSIYAIRNVIVFVILIYVSALPIALNINLYMYIINVYQISPILVLITILPAIAVMYFVWLTYKILFWSDYTRSHDTIIRELHSICIKKRKIQELYEKIFTLMKRDEFTPWVDPEMIIEIKKWIQILSESIQEYPSVFKNIWRLRKYLFIFHHPFEYIRLIHSLISHEKSDLTKIVTDFTSSIQSWTALHQKELPEVEQELEKQAITTESLSGQWAIDLQRVRLHEHIENLNKITNTL